MRKSSNQTACVQSFKPAPKQSQRAMTSKSPLVSRNAGAGRDRYRHSDIVMRLIDYVESKLASRIGLIEQVSSNNTKNL